VATESVQLTKGKTSFTAKPSHDFGSSDKTYDWGVVVSTSPAADSGNGSYKVTPACGPLSNT
jgi:serine/threonine-protein kinase